MKLWGSSPDPVGQSQFAEDSDVREGTVSTEPDNLSLAFAQLCIQLKHPYSAAQVRAAAPPTLKGSTSGTARLASERLDFKVRSLKVTAHDFIPRLPNSYETDLGEHGCGLSAGQRRLITIARALIRRPLILILDEATSALDSTSEDELLRNLKRASCGRTIIMVAHRPSGLRFADRVLSKAHGEVIQDAHPSHITNVARLSESQGIERIRPHLRPV